MRTSFIRVSRFVFCIRKFNASFRPKRKKSKGGKQKMPIYEFKCSSCGKEFEEIVTSKDNSISCPECDSSDVSKLMSACSFKSSGKSPKQVSSSSGCSSCASKNCGSCS